MKYLVESSEKKSFSDVRQFGNNLSGANVSYEDVDNELPIVSVGTSEWETLHNPTRLSRSYDFENKKELMYFLNEILEYQFDINHHITAVVSGYSVKVETYTHELGDITELDLKIKKHADEIYGDLQYFKGK